MEEEIVTIETKAMGGVEKFGIGNNEPVPGEMGTGVCSVDLDDEDALTIDKCESLTRYEDLDRDPEPTVLGREREIITVSTQHSLMKNKKERQIQPPKLIPLDPTPTSPRLTDNEYDPHYNGRGGLSVGGYGHAHNGHNGNGGDMMNSGGDKYHEILLDGPMSAAAPDLLKITANNSRMVPTTSKQHSANNVTLPSSIAIPIGLAQVFVGLSMVLCGVFALRYQSYLFYYGSGLWAGTLAGVAGILGVMATKKGLPKPKWLCGGRRWQIHIFLAAVMFALSTSILAAIFSTSGLIRDTQRDLSQNVNDMTPDEEMHEKRKSSGIAINAILLLLALLQILLSFFSLGIALKVLCSRAYCSHNGSLLSSEGSEVTVRDILGDGTGPEYEARKDRLLRWLGHQRRHFFAGQTSTSAKAIMAAKNNRNRQIVASTLLSRGGGGKGGGGGGGGNGTFDPRLYPQFVNGQTIIPRTHQYQFIQPPYVIPAPYSTGDRRTMMTNTLPMPSPYPYPAHGLMVPIIPFPIRHPRSSTPMSVRSMGGGSAGAGDDGKMMTGRRIRGGRSSSGSSVGGVSKKSSTINRATRKSNNKKSDNNKRAKKQEHEITEEEVGRTYTGLDRQVAEDFISNAMNSH